MKDSIMPAKIVVVGSFNMDLTAYMERFPRPGETLAGRKFVTGPGGKGSNQAVAAARLGAEVTFIGRLGNDVFAQAAIDFWQHEHIDTRYVVRDADYATGVAPIWVNDSGENTIVVVLGANGRMVPADVDAATAVIQAADVLVCQLEINYDMVGYALQTAKNHGVKTILNPAPAGTLPPEVIALADYITPNETELEVLSGVSGDYEAAARSLLKREGQTTVVTLGAAGARWVQAQGTAVIPSFKVDVVDTTGAGDAFNGGFAVALAEGMSLEQAIRFGNATAGLSVTKPGTSPSMPTRAEVEVLLAR
jgi:ribokinase